MIRLLTLCLLAASLCTIATHIHAQERSAGGTLDTQASWTALHTAVGAVNDRVTLLKTDVDAVSNCADKGKIWSRSKGCISVGGTVDTTDYDMVVYCGDRGLIYDKSASGSKCVRPPKTYASIKYSKCTMARNTHNQPDRAGEILGTNIKTDNAGYLYCPADYVMIGVNDKNTDSAFCCLIEQQ